MRYVVLYAIAFAIFLAIDAIWLGFIARDFYKQYLGYLMKTDINFVAAAVFYLLFIIGILVFAIVPALEKNSLQSAIMLGCFFGFITYATYDLTNYATIKDWPLTVVIVDMAWGTFLAGAVSTLTYLIAQKVL